MEAGDEDGEGHGEEEEGAIADGDEVQAQGIARARLFRNGGRCGGVSAEWRVQAQGRVRMARFAMGNLGWDGDGMGRSRPGLLGLAVGFEGWGRLEQARSLAVSQSRRNRRLYCRGVVSVGWTGRLMSNARRSSSLCCGSKCRPREGSWTLLWLGCTQRRCRCSKQQAASSHSPNRPVCQCCQQQQEECGRIGPGLSSALHPDRLPSLPCAFPPWSSLSLRVAPFTAPSLGGGQESHFSHLPRMSAPDKTTHQSNNQSIPEAHLQNPNQGIRSRFCVMQIWEILALQTARLPGWPHLQ